MKTTIRNSVSKYSTTALHRVARAIEAELMAAMNSDIVMTQSHVGQIELLTAISEVLVARGEHLGGLGDDRFR